jgi:hypothetical protein
MAQRRLIYLVGLYCLVFVTLIGFDVPIQEPKVPSVRQSAADAPIDVLRENPGLQDVAHEIPCGSLAPGLRLAPGSGEGEAIRSLESLRVLRRFGIQNAGPAAMFDARPLSPGSSRLSSIRAMNSAGPVAARLPSSNHSAAVRRSGRVAHCARKSVTRASVGLGPLPISRMIQ